jgi:hypothetical protein
MLVASTAPAHYALATLSLYRPSLTEAAERCIAVGPSLLSALPCSFEAQACSSTAVNVRGAADRDVR